MGCSPALIVGLSLAVTGLTVPFDTAVYTGGHIGFTADDGNPRLSPNTQTPHFSHVHNTTVPW